MLFFEVSLKQSERLFLNVLLVKYFGYFVIKLHEYSITKEKISHLYRPSKYVSEYNCGLVQEESTKAALFYLVCE